MQKKSEHKFLKSFACNRGRAFNDSEKERFEVLLQKFKDSLEKMKDFNKICFEIGSGNGEFLTSKASQEKDTFFIGSDVFKRGAFQMLKKAELLNLENFGFYFDDARLFIDECDFKFDEFYVLFPDPWHKARHNKRRIINIDFVNFLNTKLKDNGVINIASDDAGYQEHIIECLKNFEDKFDIEKRNYTEDDFKTKYYNKSISKNNVAVFWRLKKK